jgi:hypothetical protein
MSCPPLPLSDPESSEPHAAIGTAINATKHHFAAVTLGKWTLAPVLTNTRRGAPTRGFAQGACAPNTHLAQRVAPESHIVPPMDDVELWQRFAEQRLEHSDWNHRLHLRTAALHLQRYDFDEAHLRLRAGIIRLNQRHGLEESALRGYAETLTRVWLHLVAHAIKTSAPPPASSNELLERHPELLDRGLTLRHYSKSLLMSSRARAIYVEPDLAPLPAL